jgi:hypothetical protein
MARLGVGHTVGGLMSHAADSEWCPGSRQVLLESTLAVDANGRESGRCPVCGNRVAIGYARVLVLHRAEQVLGVRSIEISSDTP